MIIKVLKAHSGDAMLIKYKGDKGKSRNILIDGGIARSYRKFVKQEILKIKENNEQIDLLIITHTDNDHIKGVMAFIEDKEIDKQIVEQFWFNATEKVHPQSKSTKIGLKEGISLEKYLGTHRATHKQGLTNKKGHNIHHVHGAKITVLSPSQKSLDSYKKKLKSTKIAAKISDHKQSIKRLIDTDTEKIPNGTIYNNSSIAFIFEYNEKKVLFSSDAHPKIITNALEEYLESIKKDRLTLDYFKIGHHGSKANTTSKLLNLIECKNFIVSTNGKYGHPNKVTFARIIKNVRKRNKGKIYFIFNYENLHKDIFMKGEAELYNFKCLCSLKNKNGYEIKL